MDGPHSIERQPLVSRRSGQNVYCNDVVGLSVCLSVCMSVCTAAVDAFVMPWLRVKYNYFEIILEIISVFYFTCNHV